MIKNYHNIFVAWDKNTISFDMKETKADLELRYRIKEICGKRRKTWAELRIRNDRLDSKKVAQFKLAVAQKKFRDKETKQVKLDDIK